MSSMLDQAVVDAGALKEAALKNAEQIILEKFSPQVKQAVESLLEQDDEFGDEEDPMADLGLDDEAGMEGEDPLAMTLPSAATDGENVCPCPDEEEEIEIDFDELAAMSNEDPGASLAGDDFADYGSLEEDGLFLEQDDSGIDVPSYLGPDLHKYHRSMGDPIYKVGSLAYAGKPVPRDLLEDAIGGLESAAGQLQDEDQEEISELINELSGLLGDSPDGAELDDPMMEAGLEGLLEELSMDEDLEDISEADLDGLAELLNVDVNVVPHGHPGAPTSSEKQEAEDVGAARENDTKVKDDYSKLKRHYTSLQENNNNFKQQISSLILENKNIKGVALEVSKKLRQLNFQNSVLVYKNKTLKSVSLNERQKNKIVDAISKVNSVGEAKLVFETLYKSFTEKKDYKDNHLPESLNEAISKTSMTSIKPRELIGEGINPQKERMQILAGIIKKS